jgi:excisionase family DNA binding protein
MDQRKRVLTTGEVAKLCNVAPRTVSKWFDSGQLQGYRIPGGKDRRIPLEQLIRFMRAHGIPLNGLETGLTRVLVLDADASAGEVLAEALAKQGRYEALIASSAFEAGVLAERHKPEAAVLDVTRTDVAPRALARLMRGSAELSLIHLIGVANGLTDGQGQALIQEGFSGYLAKPYELRSLIELIERAHDSTERRNGE